jgi:hypothetical protein
MIIIQSVMKIHEFHNKLLPGPATRIGEHKPPYIRPIETDSKEQGR